MDAERLLYDRFQDLGIVTRTVTHPPVFTVDEAKSLRGELPGGHCKNLFLRDKGKEQYLVVALEDTQIDLRALADLIGAKRLSFGSAQRLEVALRVLPGSVTPFALLNDTEQSVQVVLERRMMSISPLHYHPLRNDKTTVIQPDDLLCFIQSCGHQPRLVDLPGLPVSSTA